MEEVLTRCAFTLASSAVRVYHSTMYLIGLGIESDLQKALDYFELSASQGNENAQYALELMYSNGWGVKQVDEKAAAYRAQRAERKPLMGEAVLIALKEKFAKA